MEPRAGDAPSDALLADSHLSAVGAVLAVTLAGVAATRTLGGWWADPATADRG